MFYIYINDNIKGKSNSIDIIVKIAKPFMWKITIKKVRASDKSPMRTL